MKLIRADEHLKALNDEVTDFLATHTRLSHSRIIQGEISAQRSSIGTLHPIGCSCSSGTCSIISDRLSITWRGVSPGQGPMKRPSFQFFAKREDFSGSGAERRSTTCPQPHRSSLNRCSRIRDRTRRQSAPLWLLQAGNIEDKHHTLNLVAAGVRGDIHVNTSLCHPSYGLTGTTGDYLTFEDGSEIFRIPGPVDPWQVQDYSRYTFDVAFDPKGPARGIRLREGLRDMRETVAEAIRLVESFIP
jgi:hypothetical protein